MARLWRVLLEMLSDAKSRLRPRRSEPQTLPPPDRESSKQPPRAPQPPYDLAKDTSTDNQKYLM